MKGTRWAPIPDVHEIHWNIPVNLSDGHRIFENLAGERFPDGEHPMVAIADESGDYPEETDDGILWLDFNRSLYLGDEFCQIPLLGQDGEQQKTLSTPVTLLALADRYKWSINVHGVLFTAHQYKEDCHAGH